MTEIEKDVVWLYKFVFYGIAAVGLLMAGIFVVSLLS